MIAFIGLIAYICIAWKYRNLKYDPAAEGNDTVETIA